MIVKSIHFYYTKDTLPLSGDSVIFFVEDCQDAIVRHYINGSFVTPKQYKYSIEKVILWAYNFRKSEVLSNG